MIQPMPTQRQFERERQHEDDLHSHLTTIVLMYPSVSFHQEAFRPKPCHFRRSSETECMQAFHFSGVMLFVFSDLYSCYFNAYEPLLAEQKKNTNFILPSNRVKSKTDEEQYLICHSPKHMTPEETITFPPKMLTQFINLNRHAAMVMALRFLSNDVRPMNSK